MGGDAASGLCRAEPAGKDLPNEIKLLPGVGSRGISAAALCEERRHGLPAVRIALPGLTSVTDHMRESAGC